MTEVEISGSVPRLTRGDIVTFARRVLRAVDAEPGELSIAFVDDTTMRALNRKFRRKNKTTDVLTFPGDAPLLGEIVISLDQARRQAIDEKHSLATEVRYLILHGILHALGYDHETDNGEMHALEVQVRTKVGLD
ncbi:MAG TPA: rRNA maturation RNase YbeY [Thermoanaerobaculia bacterium]|nr:rRNA maturation RNase YbeY [Thermoanaerobaculia bacterium]